MLGPIGLGIIRSSAGVSLNCGLILSNPWGPPQIALNGRRSKVAMLNQYPVIDIALPSFSHSSDPIGQGKGKVWVPHEGTQWLFKFPRAGYGEHWAEKITSELASLVGVNFPRVDLARCVGFALEFAPHSRNRRSDRRTLGRYGAIVRGFSPPPPNEGGPIKQEFHIEEGIGLIMEDYNPLESNYIRMSGGDVLALFDSSFDRNVHHRTPRHNMKDIIKAWLHLADVGSMNPAPLWDVALEQLASYVLLAGLVRNTDRNHSNWEILRRIDLGDLSVFPSPAFDYGSSLGADLSDIERTVILHSGKLKHFLLKKNSSIFVSRNRKQPVSPVFLASLLCRWQPSYTEATVGRIEQLTDSQICSVVKRVPSTIMSDVAKEFAIDVIITGREILSCRGRGSLLFSP